MQVVSPQLVNDVQYCTIKTLPSEVIASIPVQKEVFDGGQADVPLDNFANAIEQIMDYPHVVAAVGNPTIDRNGLTADFVDFTVQYVPPGSSGTQITGVASIPVGKLNFTDGLIGQTLLEQVEAAIDKVYANLKAAAGG